MRTVDVISSLVEASGLVGTSGLVGANATPVVGFNMDSIHNHRHQNHVAISTLETFAVVILTLVEFDKTTS